MLDFSYPKHYAELVQACPWQIELPSDWTNFFEESGIAPTVHSERRETQRRIVRMRGLLCFENELPAIQRERSPVGVYTRDFSRDACGLISPIQLFPEEKVRLILPTFWLTLRVIKSRCYNRSCYETGLKLLHRNDPTRAGFIVDGKFLSV